MSNPADAALRPPPSAAIPVVGQVVSPALAPASATARPAPTALTAPVAPAAAPAGESDLVRGRLMQRSLRVLLDQVRGSRDALPYVAALEHSLGVHGAAVIDTVPPQFLARIQNQLRVLPLSADDAALCDLVERVHAARRRHAPKQTHQLSPVDPEATVVITEGTHSDFMKAMAQLRA